MPDITVSGFRLMDPDVFSPGFRLGGGGYPKTHSGSRHPRLLSSLWLSVKCEAGGTGTV